MNHQLKTAYMLGATDARQTFEKTSARGDIATPLLGAVPGYGPVLSGIAGGLSAPENKGWAGGAGAAFGSTLGQAGGALGGAAIGGLSGYAIARLAKALGEKNVDPAIGTAVGAGLGGIGGMLGGGAYGAYKGRKAAVKEHKEKTKDESKKQAADLFPTVAGTVPILGPALAGGAAASRPDAEFLAPLVERQAGIGQLIGGVGGAALGAGGAALAERLGLNDSVSPLMGGTIGGLLGAGVGGAVGAARGQNVGRHYVSDIDRALEERDARRLEEALQNPPSGLQWAPGE